jgi:hypothetical protein
MPGQLVQVTPAQVTQAIESAPYRTVRLGSVSIREVTSDFDQVTRYSVRAWTHSTRLASGRTLGKGSRTTVIYSTQAQVADVVNAQAHNTRALSGSHAHKALTSH